MNNRTRYCANSFYKETRGKGMIEKYLSEEIDFLLTPSSSQLLDVDIDEIYISNPGIVEIENTLEQYLKYSSSDKTLFFTGLTGSGKTMILRHTFKINGMKAYIYNKCLIIPFSFDNINDSSEKRIRGYFRNMVMNASNLLVKTFSLKIAQDCPEKFYESIEEYRADNLEFGSGWERRSLDEKIRNYEDAAPLAFASSLLKFYLNQDACSIDNVLFIVDDIEGIGGNLEILPIKIIYELMICMENQRKDRRWSAKSIIACRHYVYRYAKYRNLDNYEEIAKLSQQTLEAYSPTDMKHLDMQLSLIDIIDRRYNVIKEKRPDLKWKNAMDIIEQLLKSIDKNIGDFIIHLNINNIREAFITLKALVYNRHWLQRDYDEKAIGAFKISSLEQFNVAPVNLIRALAMGEDIVYCSDESIIPNLLHNEMVNMDFITILTAKYFWKRRGENNWRSYLIVDDFYNLVKKIFKDDDYFEEFKKAVEYLILNRILLRGIDQIQKDTSAITNENVGSIKKVYVSPVLDDLFDYLKSNSVLMELYMDDIWKNNNDRSESPKMYRGYDHEKFMACVTYMDVLIEVERDIRNYAHNSGTYMLYCETFGADILSEYLLSGLENSFNAYFRGDDLGKQYQKSYIRERINKCKKFLKSNIK